MTIRMTSARQAVLDLLETTDRHLTAIEIHDQLTERLPSINISTVYRAVDFLVSHQLISTTDMGVGSPVYEVLRGEVHHHLKCERCGREYLLAHEMVAPLFGAIQGKFEFVVHTNHLVLFGLCKDCQDTGIINEEAGT